MSTVIADAPEPGTIRRQSRPAGEHLPEWVEWALVLLLALMLHPAAGGLYEAATEWVDGKHPSLALVLVRLLGAAFVFALIVVLRIVRGEAHPAKKWAEGLRMAWPWAAASATAVTTVAAGSAIHDVLNAWAAEGTLDRCHSAIAVAWLATAIGFTGALYQVRHSFVARTRFPQTKTAEQRSTLILFVSKLPDPKRRDLPAAVTYETGYPSWHTPVGKDLKAEIAAIEQEKKGREYWPWEMLLRAIEHHGKKLGRIMLVCSPESIRSVNLLTDMLNHFDDTHHIIKQIWVKKSKGGTQPYNAIARYDEHSDCDGFGFEDLDDLASGTSALLHHLRSEGIADQDIMVDFTGGQKPSSVVSACMTFNGRLQAQYVSTTWPHKVISYDLQVESQHSLA